MLVTWFGADSRLWMLLGVLLAYALTALVLKFGKNKLPKDEGRLFAHDGALSKGKPRGAGLVFVAVFVVVALLFVPFQWEMVVYLGLTVAAMLTGYFDDGSEEPWGPLKKGLLDFAIAIVTAITFVNFNGSTLDFGPFGGVVELPAVVYVILGVVLVWVSINVTNCSDGVDGLCGTLSVISLLAFYGVGTIHTLDTGFQYSILLLVATLLAYLWFNSTPSVLLMGDAGSRAIGLFLAVAAMKSGNALLFIPLALMLIVDGGAGLIKLSLARFLKIRIMKNVRTPIHDHCRKNKGWSNTHVVFRFAIVQTLVAFATVWMLK